MDRDDKKLAQTCNLSNEYFIQQAKSRWLRTSEICEILRGHNRLNLTANPPHKPPSGSLFLFDRKVLRYFRKDGHCWRKKNDGKTVREAHEKLKSGNIDALHCYYAHGEDNEDFQRRIYWLLDEKFENIVLVHYRDLGEENRILSDTDPTIVPQESSVSSAVIPEQLRSFNFSLEESYPSSPCTAFGPQSPSGFEDANFENECAAFADPLPFPPCCRNDRTEISTAEHNGLLDTTILNEDFNPFPADQMTFQNLGVTEGYQSIRGASKKPGLFDGENFVAVPSSSRFEMLRLNPESGGMHDRTTFEQANCADGLTKTTTDFLLDRNVKVGFALPVEYNVLPNAHLQSVRGEGKAELQEMVESSGYVSSLQSGKNTVDCLGHAYHIPDDHFFHRDTQINDGSVSQANILPKDHPLEYETEVTLVPKSFLENETYPSEHGELSKLYGSRGWMDKDIGKDCDDLLITSGSFWNVIETESGETELTSLSHHMHFDIDRVGPSLEEQLYSILDFSPDWGFCGDETKVLITGRFLGNLNPANFKWCCMIGENEVPAELLPTNAIRCQAPVHAPGRVPLYITRNNRSACSEIREFEYREDLHGETFTSAPKIVQEDDIFLQLRYAKLISLRADRKMQICAVTNCLTCNLNKNLLSMLRDDVTEWDKIEMDYKNLQGSNWGNKDALVQHMLKGRFYEWLVYRTHEGRGLNVLDEGGQGVIHLAASLGYQWAMRPIVAAGVNPNFRDARGRTGLHWAALYGREETVLELVKLDAAPGTVDDPTSNDPDGQTAADLACARGHKGIAGYLAELDLTTHLSKLALEESVMKTLSATVAAEDVAETLQRRKTGHLDGDEGDQSAPGRVLAAVRNSDIAARRIQAALKSESWHKRQLTRHNNQTSEISEEALIVSSLNNQHDRINHFNDYLHIVHAKDQKYHGYRGHRVFLQVRNRFVKKAPVRKYKEHKPYEKIIWAVSFLEKAILRWKRKRSGLRGFRSAKETGSCGHEGGESDEYQFLTLGRQQKAAGVAKALGRVQSMALQSDACEQYMRLATSSHQPELGDEVYSFGSRSKYSTGIEDRH